MRIINQTHFYDIIINGNTVTPSQEYTTGEMMFNSQAIFSDIGSVEIITEYGKRSFRCYGNLKAYEDKVLKDVNGMPQIMVVSTKPQNLYKENRK